MDDPPSSKKWTLTADAFEALLSWLGEDRERAGEKYEQIRSALIRGFERHGCRESEELADETINRVARRLSEIRATYVGDPARYFFGVAHNVHMEYLRRPKVVPLSQTGRVQGDVAAPYDQFEDDDERLYACLRACVERLAPQERDMILQYYCGERQVKIRFRKGLAERLGIKLENLRLRAQRVRERLKKCIDGCMGGMMPA